MTTYKWQDLVRGDEFCVPPEMWEQLNKDLSQDAIIELLQDAVDIGGMPFPYRETSQVAAVDDFRKLRYLDTKNLIEYRPWKTNFEYKYHHQNVVILQSNIGLLSSNYFHQKHRYACDDVRRMSAARSWETRKFRRGLFKAFWTLKLTQVNSQEVRKAGALRKYVAAQFRPTAAKAVYEMFGGGKVLDFSSGWGDRLSAALATSCVTHYTGIDPNLNLHPGYQAQIEAYNRNVDGDVLEMFDFEFTPKEAQVLPYPAEDAPLEGTFDMVFTSPPYFDKERYSNADTQSWKRYKTPHAWLTGFLYPVLSKVWGHLRVGGHLCVNITDVRSFSGGPAHRIEICDPMNDYTGTLPGAYYLGAVGMEMAVRPNLIEKGWDAFCEPVWVWQKRA